ncbi:MAG: PKD domain-containing protein, partial [Candidatus Micrarchaeota archaeon]|nr:PKD domain-containing protein [Candidatus Micrarchaeota archaeon]
VNTNGLSAGTYSGTVAVSSNGGTKTVPVTLSISEGSDNDPVIESIAISPSSPSVNDDLTCTITATDSDSNLDRAIFKWYRNGAYIRGSEQTIQLNGAADSASSTLSSSLTSEGDSIRCSAIVYDSTERTDTAGKTVTVEGANTDHDPTIDSLTIYPANPSSSTNIVCMVAATDSDSNLDRAIFKWYRNGNQIGSGTTRTLSGHHDSAQVTLSASETDEGDVIRCSVDVYDNSGNMVSDFVSVTISSGGGGDHDPVITSVVIKPLTAYVSSELKCETYVMDVDNDITGVSFSWKINGQLVQTDAITTQGPFVTNSLGSNIPLHEGDVVRCDVLVSDSKNNFDTAYTTRTIQQYGVPNNPPSTEAQLNVYNPTPAQDIICTGIAEDIDGNLDTMTFTWTIPNRIGSTPVKSATKNVYGGFDAETDTLPASYTQPGDTIVCTVRTVDSEGASSSASVTALVQDSYDYNTPPVAILHATPTSIEVLHAVNFDASGSYDTDGSVVSYYFDYGDGTTSGWVSSSCIPHIYYTAGTFHPKLKVKDNLGAESTWSSVTINVYSSSPLRGHEPEIYDVYITPGNPTSEDELRCFASAHDEDGDISRISLKWFVGSSLVRTQSLTAYGPYASVSDTLGSSYTKKGDVVRCSAVVYDAEGNTAAKEDVVTVGSSSPYPPTPTMCGVSIKNMRYPEAGYENRLGWIESDVINTGKNSAELELKVIVDGKVKGIYRAQMSAGSTISKHFDFSLSEGSHRAYVEAKMDCGAIDREYATIVIGESRATPASGEYVNIYPKELSIETDTDGYIYVAIDSPYGQTFTIDVRSIDDEWFDYNKHVTVDGKATEKVKITPKTSGTFNIDVIVTSESGNVFRRTVKLYSNDYSRASSTSFGLAGAFTYGGLAFSGMSILDMGSIILAIIILILLLIIIYLLYRKYRNRKDYNSSKIESYSSEAAELASESARTAFRGQERPGYPTPPFYQS